MFSSTASAISMVTGSGDPFDNCLTAYNPVDSDGMGDHCDHSDADAFTDHVELDVATDPLDACPDVLGTPGLCPGSSCDGDDAWPPDTDVNAWITITDVLKYKGKLGKNVGDPDYVQRLDLNADGSVMISDVIVYRGILGRHCTNP